MKIYTLIISIIVMMLVFGCAAPAPEPEPLPDDVIEDDPEPEKATCDDGKKNQGEDAVELVRAVY